MAAAGSTTHCSETTDSFTLFSFLDEVESRVESLRRQAAILKEEQASLISVIDELKNESLNCRISSGDFQELIANMERLKQRCQAIEVQVHTVRDEGQVKALEKVNRVLEDLETEMVQDGTVASSKKAHAFLNACLPDSVGAVDTRFQSMVLGCALDDQKEVRRRLQHLVREFCLHSSAVTNNTSHQTQESNPPVQSQSQSIELSHQQSSDSLGDHNNSSSQQQVKEGQMEHEFQNGSTQQNGSEQPYSDLSYSDLSDSALYSANDEEPSFEGNNSKTINE